MNLPKLGFGRTTKEEAMDCAEATAIVFSSDPATDAQVGEAFQHIDACESCSKQLGEIDRRLESYRHAARVVIAREKPPT